MVSDITKRKMVQYNLLKNAISAYFASIELHNKPNIAYRYETVTLLLMNAWELALKAYIKKNLRGKRSIFQDNGHTIVFTKALEFVYEDINSIKPKSFTAVKENLNAIADYRNDVAHFYCEELMPCIFTLISRCALNFVDFISTYFNRNIIEEEGLFIMPLGFKLPFNPEEFLSKVSPAYSSSSEAKRFIDKIVRIISSLKDAGIEESIVLGFDVYLQTVKKLQNSDLLAKITSQEDANVVLSTVKTVRFSDDPNAQPVKIDEDALFLKYPILYKNVRAWCKENIPGFKCGEKFNSIMRTIKENTQFATTRKLNPKNKSSAAQTFYSEAAFAEIKRIFTESD
jgi:hypothetical protein